MTYASTALEIGQGLVCDPVTDCREKTGLGGKGQLMRNGSPVLTQAITRMDQSTLQDILDRTSKKPHCGEKCFGINVETAAPDMNAFAFQLFP